MTVQLTMVVGQERNHSHPIGLYRFLRKFFATLHDSLSLHLYPRLTENL